MKIILKNIVQIIVSFLIKILLFPLLLHCVIKM